MVNNLRHTRLLYQLQVIFSKNILRRNKYTHPIINRRGLKSENLAAIVDFMCYGEANVHQKNLNDFLTIAEELRLQGI